MAQHIGLDVQGRPIFRRTSVLVADVLEQLASGMSIGAIASKWEDEDVNPDSIAEALRLAGQALGVSGGQFLSRDTSAPAGSTPTIPSTPAVIRGARGSLTLCDRSKLNYGVGERICFRLSVTNTTSTPIRYSYLGVKITHLEDGSSSFHTSWSGPDLAVPANGMGPSGNNPWEDGERVGRPGRYHLTLEMCFGSMDEARSGIGWERLTSGLVVTVG